MNILYHKVDTRYAQRLIGYIDMISGECKIRRRFFMLWRDQGLDQAYGDWLANASKHPIDCLDKMLTKVAALVEEIKANHGVFH